MTNFTIRMFSVRNVLLLLWCGLMACVSMAQSPQPTQTEIDEAVHTAVAQGRVIPVSAGSMSIPATLQQLTSLPMVYRNTVSELPYDIVILKMSITPLGSVLTVGCRFEVPSSGTALYFGAAGISVSGKSGFSGEMDILGGTLSAAKAPEIEDPANALRGETQFKEFALEGFREQLWMGLDKTTKVAFQCGEFKGFTLSGFLKAYNLVKREDATGALLPTTNPIARASSLVLIILRLPVAVLIAAGNLLISGTSQRLR